MKDNLNSLSRFLHVASYASFIVYLFSASMICGILFFLGILPIRYLLIVIIIAIIFGILFGFFVLRKKTKTIIRNIILITETVFAAAFIAAFAALNTSLNLLSAFQAGDYQIEKYSIITLKNTPFNTINDLQDQTVAIYNDHSDNYQKALNDFKKEVNINTSEYSDAIDAASALLDGRANAVLLKDAMREIISELLLDFNNKNIKIIHTFQIRTAIAKTPSADIDITKKPFSILISGIDTRGEISTVSRSDVNMIVTINPETFTILLTSIPRDYYIQLHGVDGLHDKLTHSGLYGIDMTRQTIEDLFNTTIDYYIRLNFDSTEKLINAIGGIDLTPDTTFTANYDADKSPCHFYADQTIHVDGACGLAYARTRKAYSDGDFHRIQNQQDVLIAIIDQLSANRSITAYTDFLAAAEGSIETNIPTSQIYKLINLQLDKFPHWTIDRIRVTGTSSMAYTYSITTEPLYIMEPDMDSVNAATDRINAVLNAN